ncbi:MAG: hypothetical protein O3C29_03020 [Proteobacteria bacterium]|jgi:hypothetical protein|nr:hypothetical protein [Pseudomonadota bacterium]MDA1290910.1 hypothetical protein [Pseudomonadota bacterium]
MKNHHYRVVTSYNGSNYYGWQDLGDEEKKLQFRELSLKRSEKSVNMLVAACQGRAGQMPAFMRRGKLPSSLFRWKSQQENFCLA